MRIKNICKKRIQNILKKETIYNKIKDSFFFLCRNETYCDKKSIMRMNEKVRDLEEYESKIE